MAPKKSKNTQILSKKLLDKASKAMRAKETARAQNDAIFKKIFAFIKKLDLKKGDTLVFAFTRPQPETQEIRQASYCEGDRLSVIGLTAKLLMAYDRNMAARGILTKIRRQQK